MKTVLIYRIEYRTCNGETDDCRLTWSPWIGWGDSLDKGIARQLGRNYLKEHPQDQVRMLAIETRTKRLYTTVIRGAPFEHSYDTYIAPVPASRT